MKLEHQVVSYELSKKLKELGVPQGSLFYWEWYITTEIRKETDIPPQLKYVPSGLVKRKYLGNAQHIAAYTVAELGELLPWCLDDDGGCVSFDNCPSWHRVSYYRGRHLLEETAPTEADARAKMLIYLIENKLIEASDWQTNR